MSALAAWVGRTREDEDVLTPFPARAMAALLDDSPEALVPGHPLPPGWHWLYFKHPVKSADLGPDGHERRGDFLPPVSLPRRMWAGGRLRVDGVLRLGDHVKRTSTIRAVREKEGRSGPLTFVTIEHRVSSDGGGLVVEEQDLVYLGPREGGDRGFGGPPLPDDARVVGRFTTDTVVLFRFSALTYNGHRIHFDHPYATRTEGYPGLVVHGPLLAMLLLSTATRIGAAAGTELFGFSYRGVSPVFEGEEILLSRRAVAGVTGTNANDAPTESAAGATELWAATEARGVAMSATAEWSGRSS